VSTLTAVSAGGEW